MMEESTSDACPTQKVAAPLSWSDIGKILKSIVVICLPLYSTYLFTFLMPIMSVAFSGHLNTVDLAAAGLAASIINILTMGMGGGLVAGLDILGPQAYGAKEYKKFSILLQKTFIALGLATCVIIAVFMNIESILKAWHEPADVAEHTEVFLLIFIPGVIGTLLYRALRSYDFIQGVFVAPVLSGFISLILQVLFDLLLVKWLQLGIQGVALAITLSRIGMPAILLGYNFYKQVHRDTWFGFSILCLSNWSTFMRFSVISMLSLMTRPLVIEGTILLMGLVGTVELGAHSVLYQIRMICILSSTSVGLGAGVLLGKNLGSGNSERAKSIAKLGVLFSFGITLLWCFIIFCCRSVIGNVFSNDPEVLSIVYKGVPYLILYIILEGFYDSISFIIRALGKPWICLVASFLGYYAVTLPVGYFLTFNQQMGVIGMWIGLSCGAFLAVVIYALAFFFYIDFQKVLKTAQKRSRLEKESVTSTDILTKGLVILGGGLVLFIGLVIRIVL